MYRHPWDKERGVSKSHRGRIGPDLTEIEFTLRLEERRKCSEMGSESVEEVYKHVLEVVCA